MLCRGTPPLLLSGPENLMKGCRDWLQFDGSSAQVSRVSRDLETLEEASLDDSRHCAKLIMEALSRMEREFTGVGAGG